MASSGSKVETLPFVNSDRTPYETISCFYEKTNDLEHTLRDMEGNLSVAGDFNAKTLEWGMQKSDSRGKRVVEMAEDSA